MPALVIYFIWKTIIMLHTHVYNNVSAGAAVYTDDFKSYLGLGCVNKLFAK